MDVIKVDVDLITINVAVNAAKGRLVTNLKREDFQVTDQGQIVPLEFFDSEGPASIVFLVDTSLSMKGKKWQRLTAAMKKFLAIAHPGDDYTLISFSDHPSVILRSVNSETFSKAFENLKPGGLTALHDALIEGFQALDRVPKRHKAIVLLSDGQDTASLASLSDVEREASRHRATIYSVGLILKQRNLSAWEQNGRNLLQELATTTGGSVHFPTTGEIHTVLEGISEDVRAHYCLSYYPPDKANGWRQIKISLKENQRPFNLRYQQRYVRKEPGASTP